MKKNDISIIDIASACYLAINLQMEYGPRGAIVFSDQTWSHDSKYLAYSSWYDNSNELFLCTTSTAKQSKTGNEWFTT